MTKPITFALFVCLITLTANQTVLANSTELLESLTQESQLGASITVAVGMRDRHDRRDDHRDNRSDRRDDKQDFREERRDCVGEGAGCRSDNRQDNRENKRDRGDERRDDRQDRRGFN